MGKKRKKKKVLLSGSDPFYLSKKLRRRRYGEVSAQTSQKSQNWALVKKKVAYRAPAAQSCTPPTWTINRIFSKSEILAESLEKTKKKKKKTEFGDLHNGDQRTTPCSVLHEKMKSCFWLGKKKCIFSLSSLIKYSVMWVSD